MDWPIISLCLHSWLSKSRSVVSKSLQPHDLYRPWILQARILEWVAIPFSRGSSQPRDWTQVSRISSGFLTSSATREALQSWLSGSILGTILWLVRTAEVEKWSEVTQSCLTLCDPVDCSLPGSSVHEILHARILEWVAISFSRESSRSRDWTLVFLIEGRRCIIWATREAKNSRTEFIFYLTGRVDGEHLLTSFSFSKGMWYFYHLIPRWEVPC